MTRIDRILRLIERAIRQYPHIDTEGNITAIRLTIPFDRNTKQPHRVVVNVEYECRDAYPKALQP